MAWKEIENHTAYNAFYPRLLRYAILAYGRPEWELPLLSPLFRPILEALPLAGRRYSFPLLASDPECER
jgi:hypothetical protein